ncbi:MAG: hypothetical protein O3C67_01255 [Cyanobacteria bacterium]|nr:hypothetical protein [Cyanobacteriota bacterium]
MGSYDTDAPPCALSTLGMHFTTRLNYLEPTRSYRIFLWPLARLKALFETLYQTLLSYLWNTVTGQNHSLGHVGCGGLFLGICLLSLGVYGLDRYEERLFIGFVVIWGIDRSLSRWRYFQGDGAAQVSLRAISPSPALSHGPSQNEAQATNEAQPTAAVALRYHLSTPQGTRQQRDFTPQQVAAIVLHYTDARGGPFETHLGWVWRVHLVLRDHSRYPLYESVDLTAALHRAKTLVAQLPAVPLHIAHSEGTGPYATTRLPPQVMARHRDRAPQTVRVQATPQGYCLDTPGTWGSWGQLGYRLLQQSGFLLFVVAVTQAMELLGALLHQSAMVYGDDTATTMLLVRTFTDVQFNPRWTDWVEGAIALVPLVLKGWHLSQWKRVDLDPEKIRAYRNGRLVGQVSTAAVHSVLLVTQPRPLVLVVTRTQALAIAHWPTLKEGRAAWIALSDRIAALQAP